MIDNTFACKERKKYENIELSNVQTQKSKDFGAEDHMFWVEKNGTWEKINAAQSIDSPIVNIIQGNTREVVLQWNYGNESNVDYVPQQQKEMSKIDYQVEQTKGMTVSKQIDYETIEKEYQGYTPSANQTMPTKKVIERSYEPQIEYRHDDMVLVHRPSQSTTMGFHLACIIFFRIICWLSCVGLSAAVMMALNGTSFQEVLRCSNVYLLLALPTALYIIATSISIKGEYQYVQPMNQTMRKQKFSNPTPTYTQADYISKKEVTQTTRQQSGETKVSPLVTTVGQNNKYSGVKAKKSQDYMEGNSFYEVMPYLKWQLFL